MANSSDSIFTLKNATTAYKKAKVDAWKLHTINATDFMQFEVGFKENIVDFLADISWVDYQKILSDDWLGTWSYRIKKIHPKEGRLPGEIFSTPVKQLKKDDVKSIDFRVFAVPSVRFHLLSGFWIATVAPKYNAKLRNCVYGNCLRYGQNPRASGSFAGYIGKLREWKKRAIDTTKKLLNQKKEAIVVTADATAFYHSLKPDFLLNDNYLRSVGINLTDEERTLTRLLISAINYWASRTPLESGLPVGLPVSAVIANLALVEFDSIVCDKLRPAYYGRYVDDLLIVFERGEGIDNRMQVWQYIQRASRNFRLEFVGGDKPVLDFVPQYEADITNSRISFNGEKCRVMFLDSKSGVGFIRRLENQIREVSSEFRLLPEHIGDAKSVEHRLLKLVDADGEIVDSFRKIEMMTFRKADFTGFVQEMEFFQRTLIPAMWQAQRQAFYRFVCDYILSLKHYDEYEANLFQIITLAVSCGDFVELSNVIDSLNALANEILGVKSLCVAHPKQRTGQMHEMQFLITKQNVADQWLSRLYVRIADCVQRSFNCRGDASYRARYDAFREKFLVNAGIRLLPSARVSTYNQHALIHDVSEFRYVDHLYRKEIRSNRIISDNGGMRLLSVGLKMDDEVKSLFDDLFLAGVDAVYKNVLKDVYKSDEIPYGMLFPTRPLVQHDLFWLEDASLWVDNSDVIMQAFRGYAAKLTNRERVNDVDILSVPTRRNHKVRIALVNMKTKNEDVYANFIEISPELRFHRFCKIVELINRVLRNEKNLDYIVLHELALPAEWFVPIAERCAISGVSIISGIDYLVTEKDKYCINPVWMSLVGEKDGGFRQTVYICENKKDFSYEEEKEISDRGYQNDPYKTKEDHAIIRHGDFCFSTLICSELTDIENRTRLRGLIDALFVVEWNKDVNSFAPIVEATTLDLSAYVIQCNNNEYGDNRIRVPAKEKHLRDLIRLRGGDAPYYVCESLDVNALRAHQEEWFANRDGARTTREDWAFKPLPRGYKLFRFRFPDSECAE